ncbi:MAG TPA: glycine betaine ABC transporter substrate-binding protein [Mycobacterium sp.]|nr:glycine betaine ABC transporter substrate-binding protein [Mycobacterium sp.]
MRRLGIALAFLLLAGCGPRPAPPSLTVGAGTDAESQILASLYAGALRGAGAAVLVQPVADPVVELESGALTVVPGFTGRLLGVFAPDATARSDRQVYRALIGALPEGIGAGDYATAAEDKPALAVTKDTAAAWGGDDLRGVARHCDRLTVGGVAGVHAPTTVGRCQLPTVHEFPDDTALFAALRARRVTAAWTSTADPAVPRDLVVLADGTPSLVRAENVVSLYRRNALTEPQVLALNQVAGALETAALVDMRRQVAGGAGPQPVADAWLAEHPLWH